MKIARRFLQIAVAVLLAVTSPSAQANVRPERLTIALSAIPDARGNPFISTVAPFTMVTWAIFDPLTQVDLSQPGGAVQPWLATSWEQVDRLTWRFKLRENVTFSDGTPFTAESVVGTLRFVKDKAAAHFGVASEVADIVEARAENSHSVVFTLARPDPLFPRLLSMLPIVEHQALERLGIEVFSLTPIGTGPYAVERFDTTRVSLVANPRGWQTTPSQRLEMVALGDSAARLQALVSGAIDVSLTIDPDDRPRVESIGGKVYLSPINSSLVLLLRQNGEKDSPLKNLKVRQALAHAVNREAITATIMGGAVKPATQMAAPNTIGYDPTITAAAYDPALAKRLLTEAGYPKGFTFTAKVIVGALMGDAPTYQQVAMDLQAVGVKMVLEPVPPANLARDLRNGQWTTDAMINTYSADPLLDSLRAMRFNSCINPATWVCDRTIQPVIEQAFAAETIEERDRLTRQVSRYYRQQEYGLLLHTNARLSGLGPRVKNFEATSARIRWDRVIVEDRK